MRDLVYYIATTIDGFIAREDGALSEFPWDGEFGGHLLEHYPETFPAHLRTDEAAPAGNRCFDAVIMGRKTYEVGLREGIRSPYPTLDQYLISRTFTESPDPRVVLISSDVPGRIQKLKEEDGQAIWLCGGGELASCLLAAGLIDRIIVKLNPILFGSGIPMFGKALPPTSTELLRAQPFASGHVLLEYRVL